MPHPDATVELDRIEALLWTILSTFETLASDQYAASLPQLNTPQKRAVIAVLHARITSDAALADTTLVEPVRTLTACARSTDPTHVLIVQGLLLELVGSAIYGTFADNPAASSATRELCSLGAQASTHATALVPALLRERIGTGDVLFQAIMTESGELLRSLDAYGEGIDAYFSERFGVSFADLMGDVASDLLALCIDLGVDRRKLVAYLTGALMGV